MPHYDNRIDAYIDKSAEFAQPILHHLRELVHTVCPEVEETIKWSMPFFDYKGPLANMAAFKAHCSFGFWKQSLLPDPNGLLGAEGAGSFGKIASLKDLPSDKILSGFIKAAMKLNEDNIKIAPSRMGQKAAYAGPIETPDDITNALKKNKKARDTFEAFSPSHRKEYIRWIIEAKTEATRERRIATMLEWLEEGKPRNWKYK